MKRSSSIALLAIGTVVTACDAPAQPPEMPNKTDAYQSKQECVKDWEEKACEKRYDSHSRGLVWFGPQYYNSGYYTRTDGTRLYRNPHSGIVSRPVIVPAPVMASRPGVTSVPSVGSRGGFGGTASAISVSSSGG